MNLGEFSRILRALDPRFWLLRILHRAEGHVHAGTVRIGTGTWKLQPVDIPAAPSDRDVRQLAAALGLPGWQHLRAELRLRRGIDPPRARQERERLGLAPRVRVACQFRSADPRTPPPLSSTAPTATTAARSSAVSLAVPAPSSPSVSVQQDIERELAEAQRLRAVAERRQAELELARIESQSPRPTAAPPAPVIAAAPGLDFAGLASLLRVLAEQREDKWPPVLEQLREQLQQLRAAPAPVPVPAAPPADSVASVKDALGLVQQVVALVRGFREQDGGMDDSGDEPNDLVRVLREARGLVGMARATVGAAADAPSQVRRPREPRPSPSLKLLPSEADKTAMLRERVRRFALRVFGEAACEADPAAAADALEAEASRLPEPLRLALGTGQWQSVWTATASMLGQDEWTEADRRIAALPALRTWLEEFTSELAQLWADAEGRDDADDAGDAVAKILAGDLSGLQGGADDR